MNFVVGNCGTVMEIEQVIEMQTPALAGLHLLHCPSLMPAPYTRPMTMVFPSIVGDQYHTQQASTKADQDLLTATFSRSTSTGLQTSASLFMRILTCVLLYLFLC